MIYKGYITAPRWSGVKTFLFQLAIRSNVDIGVISEENHFITKTIIYEIRGLEEDVNTFTDILVKSIPS